MFCRLLLVSGLLGSMAFGQDESKKDADVPAAKAPSPLRKVMDESLSWNELFADENSATPMIESHGNSRSFAARRASWKAATMARSSGAPTASPKMAIQNPLTEH